MRQFFVTLALILAIPTCALAGGPRKTTAAGDPIKWNTSTPVLYYVDQGNLGTLSNDAANQLVADAFDTWAGIGCQTTQGCWTTIHFDQTAQWSVDIDGGNYQTAAYPAIGSEINLIVYDDDGGILESVLGVGAQDDIPGITSYELVDVSTKELRQVSILLNGRCFDGSEGTESPCELSYEEFRGIVVHEAGHFAGLDHSDLNRRFVDDGVCSDDPFKACREDADCVASCAFRTANNAVLPTMYPETTEDDSSLAIPNLDDELALARLYPFETFAANRGTVQGYVFKSDDLTELNGANVIVRNLEDPFIKAASTVSGDVRPEGLDRDGYFRIDGLPTGNYTLEIRSIDRSFAGPRSVGQFGQCVNDTTVACWCDLTPGCFECCPAATDCADAGVGGDCDPLALPVLAAPTEYLSVPENENATQDLVASRRILKLSPGVDISNIRVVANDISTLADDTGVNNGTCPEATPVDPGGAVIGDRIESGETDYYEIFVRDGWRLRVDVDAMDEGLGSALDPEIELREECSVTPAVTTSIPDPATGLPPEQAMDPAVEYVADGDHTVAIEVTGANTSTGPYYLRIEPIPPLVRSYPRIVGGGGAAQSVSARLLGGIPGSIGGTGSALNVNAGPLLLPGPFADSDLDGLPDGQDICPGSGDTEAAAGEDLTCGNADDNIALYGQDSSCGTSDDLAGDGVCDDLDNCIATYNPGQRDGDNDGEGDRCDDPSVIFRVPRNQTQDVPVWTAISVIFSEPMDPVDLANQTLVRLIGLSAGKAFVNTINHDQTAVTMDVVNSSDPSIPEPLNGSTGYIIGVEGTVKDQDGVALDPIDFQSDPSLFNTRPVTANDILASQIGSDYDGHEETTSLSQARYGASVAAGADVDGNGFRDVMVGAPRAEGLTGAEALAGRVTLLFGDSGAVQGTPDQQIEFVGGAAGDFTGTSITFVSDMTGDGYDEILIGAPGDPTKTGQAYLIFGQEDLAQVSSPVDLSTIDDLSCNPCGVIFTGSNIDDRAGFAVSSAGDFNNDDVPDIMIGTPGADPGAPVRTDAGIVYVVHGGSDIPAHGTIPLSQIGQAGNSGTQILGEHLGDEAGTAISDWKDSQFDGRDDLLIGAPLADVADCPDIDPPNPPVCAPLTDAGIAYAVMGKEGGYGSEIDLRDVLTPVVPSRAFVGTEAGGKVGFSVWGRGDIDGDAENDVLVGAPGRTFKSNPNAGMAFVLPSLSQSDNPIKDEGSDPDDFGQSGTTSTQGTNSLQLRQLGGPDGCNGDCSIQDSRLGIFAGGEEEDDEAGFTVATSSDLNGDGIDEILVGAPGAKFTIPGARGGVMDDAGRVYVLFGQPAREPGEELLGETGVTLAGVVIEGENANGRLGESATGIGDADDSGTADLVIGAPSDGATVNANGSAFITEPFVSTQTRELLLSKTPDTTLEWNVTPAAINYAVFRGTLADLVANMGVTTKSLPECDPTCGCIVPVSTVLSDGNDDGRIEFLDTTAPDPGVGFWYQVAGTSSFGTGPLGEDSNGDARKNDAIGTCP